MGKEKERKETLGWHCRVCVSLEVVKMITSIRRDLSLRELAPTPSVFLVGKKHLLCVVTNPPFVTG
jgi:hypothetical protein